MNAAEDWRPAASIDRLELRAALLRTTRAFFERRGVLEVETPVVVQHGVTDTFIRSLPAAEQSWLRTSPEHHLKRLLAAQRRDVYEIARVFRGGESGRLHQPEFTLVEWYRLGFGLDELAGETADLILALLPEHPAASHAVTTLEYRDSFLETTGLDPFTATLGELQQCASARVGIDDGLRSQLGDDRSSWLDLLASHAVYPALPRDAVQIVCGYPAEQAMLAQLDANEPRRALRFEVFLNGIELANGFVELQNADEQRQRFESDNQRRALLGLPAVTPDEQLLAALDHGLPACAGVAVGLDRVVMLAAGAESVAAVQSFTTAG